MRLPFASLAALAVLTLAHPAVAQTEPTAAPAAPTPAAKPKPGTTAYCNALKSTSGKAACLKRVQAQASPAKAPAKPAKSKKPATSAPGTPAAAAAPASAPTQATASSTPAPSQTIKVPPLPQKTI